MRRIRLLLVLPMLACSGGSTAARTEPAPNATTAAAAASATAASTDATACNVPTPVGEDWRLVETATFTYCVPATWRTRGAKSSYAGGSITWRMGAARNATRVPFTVTQVTGPDGRVTASAPMPRTAEMSGPAERLNETIGGRAAQLWRAPASRGFTTGVSWTEPLMHFAGEANSDESARVQYTVFRSVRFK